MLYPASTFFRRDPFALMRRMSEDFDRALGDRVTGQGFPQVNVWQSAEAAAITAELAGVEPDDIEITVKDNLLTLSGERKEPEVEEGATWHRRERGYGRFSRVVRLPFAGDPERIDARFSNGVLKIAVGRPEADKPRKIEIKAA